MEKTLEGDGLRGGRERMVILIMLFLSYLIGCVICAQLFQNTTSLHPSIIQWIGLQLSQPISQMWKLSLGGVKSLSLRSIHLMEEWGLHQPGAMHTHFHFFNSHANQLPLPSSQWTGHRTLPFDVHPVVMTDCWAHGPLALPKPILPTFLLEKGQYYHITYHPRPTLLPPILPPAHLSILTSVTFSFSGGWVPGVFIPSLQLAAGF